CKIVSLSATAALAGAICWTARALGASRFWTSAGFFLFAASYPFTHFFYDLERVDALCAAILLLGIALLLARPSLSPSRAVAAGFLMGLAFFAKQSAIPTFLAAIVGLALSGKRRHAAIVALSGLIPLALGGAYLQAQTDGWFSYYCIR